MYLLATVLTEAAKKPLLMPPIGFALVAFSVFLLLGIVTWTYRDIAYRHSNKFPGAADDDLGTGHH